MSRSIEVQGVTVDEAIQQALNSLGVGRDSVEIQILHHPRSGFLGIGARRAKVRATLREQVMADGEEFDMSPAERRSRGRRRRRRKVARRIRKSSGIPRVKGVARTRVHDASHATATRRQQGTADNRTGKTSRTALGKARKRVSRARMKVKTSVNGGATAKEVVAVEVGASEDRETAGIAGRPTIRRRLLRPTILAQTGRLRPNPQKLPPLQRTERLNRASRRRPRRKP